MGGGGGLEGSRKDWASCMGVKNRSQMTSHCIVQELCESQGGHPELSVLTSLLVSVDVKNY